MKKIVSILMSIALLASMATTAFASEQYQDGNMIYGDTDISIHIYSTYLITIPAIVGSSMGTSGTVEITNAYLEDGYTVDVYATNLDETGSLVLNHINKSGKHAKITFVNAENNFPATAENPLVTFTSEDLERNETSEYGKTFYVNVDDFNAAGDFAGVLSYTFACC